MRVTDNTDIKKLKRYSKERIKIALQLKGFHPTEINRRMEGKVGELKGILNIQVFI